MAIASAVHRGAAVNVYDERGVVLCTLFLSQGDILQGYTTSTVSIRRGNVVSVYNEKGSQISTIFV